MIRTKTYTGLDTISIKANDGFCYVSMKVESSSTSPATLTGIGTFSDGTVSSGIEIEAGQSVTFDRSLDPIVFTVEVPVGCVVSLFGY